MLRVTIVKVDQKPETYSLLLEDPMPERGRPVNVKVLMSRAGLDALGDAVSRKIVALDKPISVLEKSLEN